MSDTPIYDNVGSESEYQDTDSMHVKDTRAWIVTEQGRRWLYSIAAAVLVIVAGYLGLSAAEQESWLNLVSAVLNVGGAAALGYARKRVN